MTRPFWLSAALLLAVSAAAPAGERKAPPPPAARGWMDCKESPGKHPGPWRKIDDTPEQAKLRQELAGKGKIAFGSNRDGNWEIYVCDADGKNQTNLTKNPAWDFYPRWSPDGRKILFYSDRGSAKRIADRVDQLLEMEMAWTRPRDWEPQSWGCFVGVDVGLYAMNADGSDVQRLLPAGSRGCLSPNGKFLVYEHQDTIFVKNLASGEVKLGTPPHWGGAWEPSYLPDGKTLLCMTGHDSGYAPTLFPLGADGYPTGKYRVLCEGGEGCHPRLSPDGKRVVYCQDTRGAILRWVSLDEKPASDRGMPPGADTNLRVAGGRGLVRGDRGMLPGTDIDLGGEHKTKSINACPAVSPDGQYVAFAQSPVYFEFKPRLEPLGYRQWSFGRQIIWQELCVTRADGKTFVQLTDGGFANRDPDWTAAR